MSHNGVQSDRRQRGLNTRPQIRSRLGDSDQIVVDRVSLTGPATSRFAISVNDPNPKARRGFAIDRGAYTRCSDCGHVGLSYTVNPQEGRCRNPNKCAERRDLAIKEGTMATAAETLAPEELLKLGPEEISKRLGISIKYAYELQREAQYTVLSQTPEPPTNQKEAILRALYTGGKADTANALLARIRSTGFQGLTDTHNLVHVVWALQKQRLVTFYERRNSSVETGSSLMAIRLTAEGYARAEALVRPLTAEVGLPHRDRDGRLPEKKEETMVAEAIMAKSPTRMDVVRQIMAERPGHLWTGREMAEEMTKRGHGHVAEGSKSDLAQLLRVLFRQNPAYFESVERGLWRLKGSKMNGKAPSEPPVPPKPSVEPEPVVIEAKEPEQAAAPVTSEVQTASVDLFAGLALIDGVYEKSLRRDKLMEAARTLEESGEDELAIAVMSRIELSPLETEVATLVGRIKGGLTGGSGNTASGGSAPRD